MVDPRAMWQLYEPVHAVAYFAPEPRAAADAIWSHRFWRGYFAMRAAPLGEVGPDVVTAAFHGFSPLRAAQELPAAWSYATPAEVLDARLTACAAVLRRLLPGDVAAASALAWEASQSTETEGRVLAAANRALPEPSDPYERLWQATTTLREHRGDGHIAALVVHGVTAVQSHVLKVAAGESSAEQLQRSRKWTADDWAGGEAELRSRGWIADGRLTAAGVEGRAEIERLTDEAAAAPWRRLGAARTEELADLLRPHARAVVASGLLPEINGIGLPFPK